MTTKQARNAWLICLGVVLIICLLWGLFGCALPKTIQAQAAGECFDHYDRWYQTLNRTDSELEIDVAFKLYAFGTEARKQAWWVKNKGKSNFTKCPNGFAWIGGTGLNVICDLRVTDEGYYVLPPHVLGHEVMHLIDWLMTAHSEKFVNPDKLVSEDIY